MNISMHSRFGSDHIARSHHGSSNNGSAVWRVSLAVLIATNSMLLFFLYIYDII